MLEGLFSKMTSRMLWCLIIPVAIFILALSGLITSYGAVVWNSDQVSYEGSFGKISAKASTLQTRLDDALKSNKELTDTVNHLKQNLKDLKDLCIPSAAYTGPEQKENILSNKFIDINKSLKNQSDLLDQQKIELKSISNDVMQFKDILQMHLDKKNNMKK